MNKNNWAIIGIESTTGNPALVFSAQINSRTEKSVMYSSFRGETRARAESVLIENLSEEQAKMIESVLADRRLECLRETELARARYAECERRVIARMKNRDLAPVDT